MAAGEARRTLAEARAMYRLGDGGLPRLRIVERESGEAAAAFRRRVAEAGKGGGLVYVMEEDRLQARGRREGRLGNPPLLPAATLAAQEAAQRADEGQDDGPLKPVCLGTEGAATPDPEPGRLSLVPAPFPDPSTWRVRVDAETGRKLLIMHRDAPVSTPEDVAQATADAAYRAALGALAKKGSN